MCSSDGVFIDTEKFEQFSTIAFKNNDVEAGETALRLYRGDLLIEDVYEDWLSVKNESLRLLYRKIAAETAVLQVQNGNRH
jgi:DNA-binding SARP family transcriptional activator